MKTIGAKIDDLITSKSSVSKTDVANAIGITPQYLSGIISNKKNPSLRLLQRMADYLDVTLDYFTGDNIDVKPFLPNEIVKWLESGDKTHYLHFAKMLDEKKISFLEAQSILEILYSKRP